MTNNSKILTKTKIYFFLMLHIHCWLAIDLLHVNFALESRMTEQSLSGTTLISIAGRKKYGKPWDGSTSFCWNGHTSPLLLFYWPEQGTWPSLTSARKKMYNPPIGRDTTRSKTKTQGIRSYNTAQWPCQYFSWKWGGGESLQ